jgi:hypothetical protein
MSNTVLNQTGMSFSSFHSSLGEVDQYLYRSFLSKLERDPSFFARSGCVLLMPLICITVSKKCTSISFFRLS